MKGCDNIKKKLSAAALCCFAIYVLINHYGEIKSEILGTLNMWCMVLLPSIFPYLVLSQYLNSSGIVEWISRRTTGILQKLTRTDSREAGVFICSMICGYPSGAVCAADLYRSSQLSKSGAERLIGFTNNAGPLFLISAVGSGMLGSAADGIALYVIQIISAMCYAYLSGSKGQKFMSPSNPSAGKKDFCECVKNAVVTIMNIGGFVVTVAVVCRIIIIALSPFVKDTAGLELAVYSLFEISKGAAVIALYAGSPVGFAFLCAAVSWSGISVLLQVRSVLPKEIRTHKYIKAKLIQSGISFVCGFVYKSYAAGNTPAVQTDGYFLFSFVMTVLFFAALLFSYRQKKLR